MHSNGNELMILFKILVRYLHSHLRLSVTQEESGNKFLLSSRKDTFHSTPLQTLRLQPGPSGKPFRFLSPTWYLKMSLWT